MLDRFEIHPDYRHALEQAGLADFETIMACQHVQWVGRHSRRDVVRLGIQVGDERRQIYLKRDYRPRFKDLFAGLLNGWGWATKALWEWRAIHALRAAGIGCAEPIGMGQRGLVRPRGFLILAEFPDAIPLGEALNSASLADRRLLIAALAGEVARLHDAGFDQPDLYAKHVWVARREGDWQILLLDFQRTRHRRFVDWRHRLRDLAALNSTLANDVASTRDRLRFLRRYLQLAGRPARLGRIAARLARRTQRLIDLPVIARRRAFSPLTDQRRELGTLATDADTQS